MSKQLNTYNLNINDMHNILLELFWNFFIQFRMYIDFTV